MFRPNNELGYMWEDGTDRWGYSSGLTIVADKWNHVALVITASNATLYLNGLEKSIDNRPCNVLSMNTTLYVGSDGQRAGRYFKGVIDELRVWNTSRSQTEIEGFMNVNLIGDEVGLSGYWQMDDEEDVLTDTKNSFNGVFSGGIYVTNDNPAFVGNNTNMIVDSITVETPKNQLTNPGATNVGVLRINIKTTGALNPLSVSNVKANTDGTTETVDILKAKMLYTAGIPNTSGGNNFGSDFFTFDDLSFTGDQKLTVGDNFFWLVYDLNTTAKSGNVLDGACLEVTVSGIKTIPDVTNPEGNIIIYEIQDYTKGLTAWFNQPTTTAGKEVWTHDGGGPNNPDSEWERKSFPIGNGSIGGNVLGSIDMERVTFNEKTLWKGGPNYVNSTPETYWNMNKDSYQYLSQIQAYMVDGNTSAATSLVNSHFDGNIPYSPEEFGSYTTVGEFQIYTGISKAEISNYKRILSLDSSQVIVQFVKTDAVYERKFFCSYPDNVMVMQFSASRPGKQDVDFALASPHPVTSSALNDGLLYKGYLENNNEQFAVRIFVKATGGTVTIDNTNINVSGADNVVFIIAADTDYSTDEPSYNGVDPEVTTLELINSVKGMTYSELFNRHYSDYSNLFNRVSVDINPDKTFDNIPVNERLAKYKSGIIDNDLEELYFQFGRYLLISSSREGNMPANLQGIWANRLSNAWNSDYHNNINVQMNYWPAGICNLNECHLPLIEYIKTLVGPGAITAEKYYNARGWTAEISGNIYGFTAPFKGGGMSWNYNPVAGPWLASHVWDYYDFTRDLDFLSNTGYDLLSLSAQFTVDYLFKQNDGSYTATPSWSPEHGGIDMGCTYNHAVCRELLDDAIRASEVLGVDELERQEWKDVRDNISPYKVGQYGQLQEWFNDIDDPNDQHRHVNHLFGLHPGHDISPITTPSLSEACRTTLTQRGDGATGWSMGWKLNQWARLHDGNHAYKLYQNLLQYGTADNLWDLHPPFQIDGNFGGTAGVAEMMLQSHIGVIHLMPSIPDAWEDGDIKGLCARGDFEIDMKWEKGELTYLKVLSRSGGECKMHYKGSQVVFETEAGKEYFPSFSTSIAKNSEATDFKIKIYPNPVEKNALLSVENVCQSRLKYTIYSSVGKVVKKSFIDSGFNTIDISSLTKGIYVFSLKTSGMVEQQKIIIN